MNQHLIDRLAEEWAQLDHTDPLRGLISDAIAEINKQPAQQEPTIAACIIGADAVGKKIDGYEAAKVYAAMQKATRFETAAPQPAQRKPLTPAEVHDMAEAHGIDGDARHWYVVGLVDAQAKHNIKDQP